MSTGKVRHRNIGDLIGLKVLWKNFFINAWDQKVGPKNFEKRVKKFPKGQNIFEKFLNLFRFFFFEMLIKNLSA